MPGCAGMGKQIPEMSLFMSVFLLLATSVLSSCIVPYEDEDRGYRGYPDHEDYRGYRDHDRRDEGYRQDAHRDEGERHWMGEGGKR